LVVGPEAWGWSGYTLSGYNQQYGSLHGWSNLPDRNNHGGWDYLPWLLDQMRQNQIATGQRLLDIFTVHYYPQGGEFSNDTSNAMQLRRNRSTRSLWDPNYVDESWINERVQLVQRLKSWITAYYPRTFTGVTEYHWGAESHINGAGGYLRHIWPRRFRYGGALNHAGCEHADLQGDEAVSQLRR